MATLAPSAENEGPVYFTGQNRAGCGVVVKKGNSVFEVRLYGFDLSQAKTVSKTLAQNAAATF